MAHKLKMVKVDWVDSSGDCGWKTDDYVKAMTVDKCVSAGLLILKNKESVRIALTHDDFDHWSNPFDIPRCAVKKITPLKEDN